ncbi:aminotransferase class V-fold PLP-dependent enzyme [Synechococcus sp. Nb3U1]|uniref:aminotransferase class V-fold PLP-dependent enzyme n=1 Tax=Synechococcus sp. Nb3U1 TaxID=1914529 RepID=UPI001F236184|nr:aminotransferase class V-fold PLP-dependent enzyme [Synechococcus sp. Nb3U1]
MPFSSNSMGFDSFGFGSAIRSLWGLEPQAIFLNHGSYGAAPKRVLQAQSAWRERLEAQPVRFMGEELPQALRRAAAELAHFVGAEPENLVFVENATSGVNAVLRSLSFQPGDEIAFANQGYGAVQQTIRWVCGRTGSLPVEAQIPFPIAGPEQVIAAFEAILSPQTRLAILDHITSPTALIYPLPELISLCRERGIPVLVDGAHAPGILPLKLENLGADWYTGNAHKWLFAPKGCAFLWVAPHQQAQTHPTVISHGYGQGFTAEFDWVGTRDPSAWLAISAALQFIQELGVERIRQHNHTLMKQARQLLLDRLQEIPPVPEDMLGFMATLPLPPVWQQWMPEQLLSIRARQLHDYLWHTHHIEVPIIPFGGQLWVRISAQLYNYLAEYEQLALALERLPDGFAV